MSSGKGDTRHLLSYRPDDDAAEKSLAVGEDDAAEKDGAAEKYVGAEKADTAEKAGTVEKPAQEPARSTWSAIFEDRGYLRLDESKLRAWVAANHAFFGVLGYLFASGRAILDVGSGPGRHACGAASLGYQVVGIDVDPEMVSLARQNAGQAVPAADVEFRVLDLADVPRTLTGMSFDVVTHGGLLEHFATAQDMRAELRRQLRLASNVVFDVPIRTARNEALFVKDDVFRHVWDADQWLGTVLSEFDVAMSTVELRTRDGMTDDLVVWIRR